MRSTTRLTSFHVRSGPARLTTLLEHLRGGSRVAADWRNTRMTRAACSTPAMPLPRTSPTTNLVCRSVW